MKVFLSHIHEESKLAQILKEWIESTFAGQIQVFVSSDIKNIPAGSQWLSEIDSALTSSGLFLMLCSPASISRAWINFEAGCAWIKKVPLIPLCHSGMKRNGLPSPISTFQAIEIENNNFVNDFFESLKIHFNISKLPRIDKNAMVEELKQALISIKSEIPKVQQVEKTNPVRISTEDALNLIESWLGARPDNENKKTIRFSDVDSELNLIPGTAKQLIETAAGKWYVARRRGEDTILFEDVPIEPIF